MSTTSARTPLSDNISTMSPVLTSAGRRLERFAAFCDVLPASVKPKVL